MKARFLALALFGSLMLAFGAIAAGCDGNGGGDALTLEEFFQRVQELDNDFEAKAADLGAQAEGLTEESSVDEAVALFRQQVGLIEEFVTNLDALEAPPEAADLVEEAVSAGNEAETALNDAIDEASDAETLDELFAVFAAPEVEAAFTRFDQVCLDAEQLAADNDITVDLNCEEDE